MLYLHHLILIAGFGLDMDGSTFVIQKWYVGRKNTIDMPSGTLEVLLVGATGIKDTEIFG